MTPTPPLATADQLPTRLADPGFAVLAPSELAYLVNVPLSDLRAFELSWDDLPPDLYLRDGGRYRRRRHACFVVDGERVDAVAHRAHWQPVEYNALHGGLERWFEAMAPQLCNSAAWRRLLAGLGQVASAVKGVQPWYVEAHQFRIDTTDGIGRPTPEGAHRDGVDLVAVLLISRVGIKGGETRVFDADGPAGSRFTLSEPWTLLMLDDALVIHETTPIQPVDPDRHGWRDSLVITLRAGGFQGPPD
ncbi:2OG-Fe dioxygenase family protein [Piscinibacter sakaiensis]|uniref:2OG-Fe dioxygenase family protein n=1 Tax=Piscinibacter sakaiensis TaxID=1547922 RepID=UPI003AB01E59